MLSRGLSDDETRLLAEALVPADFAAGDVIYKSGDPSRSLYFVVRGRVELSVPREAGAEIVFFADRGDHFGEVSLLTGGTHASSATAVAPTLLLELDAARFDRLLVQLPAFSANLSLSLVSRFRSESVRKHRRQPPAVVCLVNATRRARLLAPRLAARLVELGESVHVLTDRADAWPPSEYPVESIAEPAGAEARLALTQERVQAALGHHERVLIDLGVWQPIELLADLLATYDETWWLAETAAADDECQTMRRIVQRNPSVGARVHFVWVMREDEEFGPVWDRELGIAPLDFKAPLADREDAVPLIERQGMSRLVRHVRGTRLGLALGGGGARGMAHLGVLMVLNREGIFFDHLAGTSSGALMGMSYASGWSAEHALCEFRKALAPSPWFKLLPGRHRWYLGYMFRTGAWDRMLRPYLGRSTLEQLQIPLSTVTVDLISGEEIVRDRGDAIHAILESINIPVISRPIVRDRRLLVDGAVLNNLPGNVLHDRDVGFIVGIDVVAKLPRQFAGNTADTPSDRIRRPGPIQTLLRVDEVQAYGLTAVRSGAIDFMITPDTAQFEFADFTKALDLARAGEVAAEDILPQLKQAIADFESRTTSAVRSN